MATLVINIHSAAGMKKNSRINDPYIDRRSGEERREVYDLDYFPEGGKERRARKERRKQGERRDNWVRVSRWSSVITNKKP
jgi:hypothetical protein